MHAFSWSNDYVSLISWEMLLVYGDAKVDQ